MTRVQVKLLLPICLTLSQQLFHFKWFGSKSFDTEPYLIVEGIGFVRKDFNHDFSVVMVHIDGNGHT